MTFSESCAFCSFQMLVASLSAFSKLRISSSSVTLPVGLLSFFSFLFLLFIFDQNGESNNSEMAWCCPVAERVVALVSWNQFLAVLQKNLSSSLVMLNDAGLGAFLLSEAIPLASTRLALGRCAWAGSPPAMPPASPAAALASWVFLRSTQARLKRSRSVISCSRSFFRSL